MGLCQEMFADKWGQASGPPSENRWACGLVRLMEPSPRGPKQFPLLHSQPTGVVAAETLEAILRPHCRVC